MCTYTLTHTGHPGKNPMRVLQAVLVDGREHSLILLTITHTFYGMYKEALGRKAYFPQLTFKTFILSHPNPPLD